MTLNELHQLGWLKSAADVDAAEQLLAKSDADAEETDQETRGIVRVLMGVGAWLSGIFLCGFLAVAFESLINNDLHAFAAIGAVTIAIGVAIQRCLHHVFFEQLGLAICVAGHVALSVGLYDVGDSEFVAPLIGFVLLCPLTYWLSGKAVQRYLSVSMIWLMVLMGSFDRDSGYWLFSGILVALVAVLILLSGKFPQGWLRPAAVVTVVWLFGLTFAAVAQGGGHGFWNRDDYTPLLAPLGMAMGLGMTALLAHLCQVPKSHWTGLGVFVAVLAVLAWFQAPGLVAALGLMAVSHARRDRLLGWVALVGVAVFLAQFYHYLGVTLLVKSIVLMSAGAVLLCFGGPLIRRSNQVDSNGADLANPAQVSE